MANVISNGSVTKHNVDKYIFKVLSVNQELGKDDSEMEKFDKDKHPERRESDIDTSSLSTNSKDSLIESLMKKTDEMSSNFIKLQMKLESMQEEHKEELKKLEEDSFAKGVEAGKVEINNKSEATLQEKIDNFSTSVKKLEDEAKKFDTALESIKSDLMTAALDISKEVIKVEVDKSSKDIARTLADELIKELQGASKITLKVNPRDHGSVSEHIGAMEHIEIISDSAISIGGVIAMSDVGNIDAQISKRFEKVKRAVLSS